MKNWYFWAGVITCAPSLKVFFVTSGEQLISIPTNAVFCIIYSFTGGFFVFRWSVIFKLNQSIQHQWVSFLFPFIGVGIAVLLVFGLMI